MLALSSIADEQILTLIKAPSQARVNDYYNAMKMYVQKLGTGY